MAIYHHFKQRSEEWYEARRGRPTASEFDRIVTPKAALSKSSVKYMNELLAQWMTGKSDEDLFENDAMAAGKALEPQAVAAFELHTELETQEIGFVTTDDGMIGASPDRLVGDTALLEAKCPFAASVHVGYMRAGGVAEEYKCQVQGQLWVAERDVSYTVSYHGGLPTVIVKVGRDEPFIKVLGPSIRQFVDQMLEARADLEARYGGPFTHGIEVPA